MSQSDSDWSATGQGDGPAIAWSFSLDAPMVDISLARETGDILAVDTSGGLYQLDRRGRIKRVTRGFKTLTALAWSDRGTHGAVATGSSKLYWFDQTLKVKWSKSLPAEIISLAVDPHAHYIAVSLANSETMIFDSRKQQIASFETIRPLKHLSFVASKPLIVGAAEYGLICCHQLDGAEVWSERLWSNVGDLTVTGDGEQIFMARFNHGVQTLDSGGHNRGSYVMRGTPNHISTSFVRRRLGVTTVERNIYWLSADGELIWATTLPDDVCGIRTDALGRGMTCGLRSGRIYHLEWPAEASPL